MGLSDISCQMIEKKHELDIGRFARMASWGLLVNGPAGHAWYHFLDKLVKVGGAKGIISKLILDQAVFTPPFIACFFVWQQALSGDGMREAFDTAKENLWPTLKVNWSFWSVAHLATFSVVPLEYRVLFVNVKNFVWGGFLSAVASGESKWH